MMRNIEQDRQWWEPIVRKPGDEFYDETQAACGEPYNDWLCDHLGDAQENMDALWVEVEVLRADRKSYFDALEKCILEREALRAEVEQLNQDRLGDCDIIARQRAEVERLREQVARCADVQSDWWPK